MKPPSDHTPEPLSAELRALLTRAEQDHPPMPHSIDLQLQQRLAASVTHARHATAHRAAGFAVAIVVVLALFAVVVPSTPAPRVSVAPRTEQVPIVVPRAEPSLAVDVPVAPPTKATPSPEPRVRSRARHVEVDVVPVDEPALIDAARTAIRAGDLKAASVFLDEHEHRAANGALVEEREALRALVSIRRAQAEGGNPQLVVDDFVQHHSESLHRAMLEAAVHEQ